MLRGFKHAMQCTKCEDIRFCEPNEIESLERIPSTCCNAPYEYIGVRMHHENIIRDPEQTAIKIEKEIPTAANTYIAPEPATATQVSIKPEEVAKPEVLLETSTFNIEDIIEIGARGVSNAQMIPAMRNALDENSIEKLQMLRQYYPAVFEGSIRYIGKKYQEKLKELTEAI